jgi:aldehyde dehydrogenase (NAD+)
VSSSRVNSCRESCFVVDEAVEIAHNAIFTNHGQNCCAGSRTFVQSGIYDAFVKKAVEKARARKVGDPFDASVQQGPQVSIARTRPIDGPFKIDKPSLDKILRLVASGKEQGAKLETGGAQIGTEGYFVQPTVFSNVTDQMSIAKEEVFDLNNLRCIQDTKLFRFLGRCKPF